MAAGPAPWWQPLTSTAILVGVVTVFAMAGGGALVIAGVDPTDPSPSSPASALADFAGGLLLAAGLLPCVLVAVRWGQCRHPGSVTSVAGRLRLRWLAWCTLAATVATAVQVGTLLLLTLGGPQTSSGRWVGPPTFVLSVAVLLPLVPLQAAAEEYVARGWFVQAVGCWVRSPWPGIVLGGAVWTALHGPSTRTGVADLMLFSLVAGWLTVRTGGLEAAVALHAAGNLTVSLILAASGQLSDDGTAGDGDWRLLAADLIALPLYAAAIILLHRRRGPSRLSPHVAPPERVSHPARTLTDART